MCPDLIFRLMGFKMFNLPITPDVNGSGSSLSEPRTPPSVHGSPPRKRRRTSATLSTGHADPEGPVSPGSLASPVSHVSPKDPPSPKEPASPKKPVSPKEPDSPKELDSPTAPTSPKDLASPVPHISHTPLASPGHSPFRSPSPSTPLDFPTEGFEIISDEYVVEEELMWDVFHSGYYYPVHIGDVYDNGRYQVIGKLGFGRSSTVWLARDLIVQDYVTLKIYTIDPKFDPTPEVTTCFALRKGDHSHPGYQRLRSALGTCRLPREDGRPDNFVLIQEPMWDSWRALLDRNPSRRFTPELLRPGLRMLFQALDYLHTECKLVHTDIKADNILQSLEEPDLLDDFVRDEFEDPSPRKLFDDGTAVYVSRRFGLPRQFGDVVLSDFGSAFSGEVPQIKDVQPDVYRSPEVMLKTDWSYAIDIWNVGAMIWDIFEGKHLFHGQDPDGKGYSTRAHLAEAVALLGLPPRDLLEKGKRTKEFFDEDGQWKVDDIPIPTDFTLESSEENFEGEEKAAFLDFMRCMLAWRPEDRMTARELANHPWLCGSTADSPDSPRRSI